MGLLVAFLIILAVVAVIVIAKRQLDAIRAAWKAVADELGLSVESLSLGQSRITGTVDGFTVTVEITGSGDNAHTRYRIEYPPLAPAFELRRESGGQKILKKFGAEDRQIGDQEFDDAFIVQAIDPGELEQWLTASRRSSLLRLLAAHPAMLATERQLQISSNGVERNPEVIVATVRRMLVTARHLVGRPSTSHRDEAAELRTKGDLLAALRALDAAVQADPDDADTRLLRAETALSAGETEQATRDLDTLERELAADPEVRGMREVLERPDTGAGSPAGAPADPDGIFDEIFGESRLSFETDDLFAREYKGRHVKLTGAVRSARPYDTDLDFGAGPGIKAVVTVAMIESDLYGNTAIDAVVDFPAHTAHAFQRGDEITFSGILAKVDPMMRNVFVTEGRLAG